MLEIVNNNSTNSDYISTFFPPEFKFTSKQFVENVKKNINSF